MLAGHLSPSPMLNPSEPCVCPTSSLKKWRALNRITTVCFDKQMTEPSYPQARYLGALPLVLVLPINIRSQRTTLTDVLSQLSVTRVNPP